jgi:carbon-monoxide dehydrogenase iron sulfur subunit
MRYLKIDLSKCEAGKNCNFECETECSTRVFKSKDRRRSAIQVREIAAADGQGPSRIMVSCDQCGDCIEVCPANALTRNRLGVVVLDKKACVGCYMCVGFCDNGTFFQTEGWLEPHKCTACGVCVKVCPHGALEIIEAPISPSKAAEQAEERV